MKMTGDVVDMMMMLARGEENEAAWVGTSNLELLVFLYLSSSFHLEARERKKSQSKARARLIGLEIM